MFRRRNPDLLSQYLCHFCGSQIAWGSILRILRTDPGQPDYMQVELYAHRACARAGLRPEVPLAMARHWDGKPPLPDDSHEIAGRPCGLCGETIAAGAVTALRLQEPIGLVRKPEFMEESVPVHAHCLRSAAAQL